MSREYYIYPYRFNNKDSYLIWFSNEEDGVIVNENGIVPSFDNIKDLQVYSEENKISVDIESSKLLNLDLIQKWLTEDKSEIEDYNNFLDAWNLFGDFSKSIDESFDADKKNTNKIYDEIFWGCNIPVVTPVGKSYKPIWTKKELKIIRKTLNFGFQMFTERVREQ
jgi:hypothetical protein